MKWMWPGIVPAIFLLGWGKPAGAFSSHRIVVAGLDPAIPLNVARPYHMIGIAGSSPAMTAV
jgi:hypothetical protein